MGKPKVKIKTIAERREQGYIHTSKAHTGRKPKVRIKHIRGLWMGKPKVKMKKTKRKNGRTIIVSCKYVDL